MPDRPPLPFFASTCIAVAGMYGLTGVALGAIASHAARDPAAVQGLQLASLYALLHAPALLALGFHARRASFCLRSAAAALFFILGVALFCGSLALKALWGLPATPAPAGGMLLMLGWFFVFLLGLIRSKKER